MSSVNVSFPSYGMVRDVDSGNQHKSKDLTCVVRTDSDVATQHLQDCIKNHTNLSTQRISKIINGLYKTWGENVITHINDHLDYGSYENHIQNKRVSVHFYRAAHASENVIRQAVKLLRGNSTAEQGHYLLISLDDMIEPDSANSADFAFSRKFNANGNKTLGYVGRPGHASIKEQLQSIKVRVDQMSKNSHGLKVPLVFLEDNIRHAKMINWVIDLFEKAGIFENGSLDGISTCFCSADSAEREKVIFEGKSVPIVTIADYDSRTSDVITPRDLLFDGFVVDIDGHIGRLPALFMDVSARFKIKRNSQNAFKQGVAQSNIEFCEALAQQIGVSYIPLNWFEHGETISKKIGCSIDSNFTKIMHSFLPPVRTPSKFLDLKRAS